MHPASSLFAWSLAACSFTPGTFSGTGSGDDGAVADVDGQGSALPPFVRAIEIDAAGVVGGPHADFPLLVALSDNWLRSTAFGGRIAHPSGFDIQFTADAAGQTLLAHEIELYGGDTGALVAWVKIPSLSPTTVLYIHYGDTSIASSQENVAAVWSAGFAGVWHLIDGRDSSTLNGMAAVTGTTVEPGKVGNAQRFDATDDAVDAGSATAIDDVFQNGGTAEGWFYATGWGESSYGRLFDKGHAAGWSLGLNNAGPLGSVYFLHGATSQGRWDTNTSSIQLDRWTHVALVYDQSSASNDAAWYVDGAAVTTTRSQTPSGTVTSDATTPLHLGNRPGLDRTFDGLLDELRLSSVARSAGWIETTVRNQSAPGAFYTLGPEL